MLRISKMVRSIPAVYMRGGTSKGLLLQSKHLPPHGEERDDVICSLMGPDRWGLQIDGLGGGTTSTNKVCVVDPSEDKDTDVEYRFGQVSMKERKIDWSSNCGNMASAVGLFAVEQKLVQSKPNEATDVRVHLPIPNVRMLITIPPENSSERVTIPNVEGSGPPIGVQFIDPTVGTNGMYPTGNPLHQFISYMTPLDITCISAGNPTAICDFDAVDYMHGHEIPADIEKLPEKEKKHIFLTCSNLREKAGDAMKVNSKFMHVVLLCQPRDYTTSGGEEIKKEDIDLISRVMVAGDRMHHAHPGTALIAIACSATTPGTITNRLLIELNPDMDAMKLLEGPGLRVGHPGGVMTVKATMDDDGNVKGAGFVRTARTLMSGNVFLGPPYQN